MLLFKSIPSTWLNIYINISYLALNALLAFQDLVKRQRGHNYISKTSSNINQLVYYLPKLYCNKTVN